MLFPVVGARTIFDPLIMTEPKYPMEERYAPLYYHLCHPNTIYINTCLIPYDGGYWHIHKKKWYVHETRSTKGFEGNIVEPVLWPSPRSGLGKYSLDTLRVLYGPHLITGNTLVELS